MDVETWTPYGVCVDVRSGDEVRLDVTVYHVSETGQYVFSPDLIKISIAQAGYGVCVPSERVGRNFGASKDDGIFVLDRHSGKHGLLLSFSEIYNALPDRFVDLDLSKGAFYGFHTKVNRQSDKVIFIIRWLPHDSSNGKTKNYLITCDVNGGDIHMAVDSVRWGGGHHPNWCPDGRSIVMNLVEVVSAGAVGRLTRLLERVAKRVGLRYFSNAFCMRFAIFDYMGSDFRIVAKSHFGSGHPSLSLDGRHIVTDCYPYERVAFGDGTVPLRLIDIENDASKCLVRVPTRPNYEGRYREYRIDPHPVWDREGKLLIFNAAISGQRSVFVADLSGCL
ncbi:MAG: hypothetical protein LCH90_04745 [Proteobacteria bacterium]|nr:hypothetical protein [Pseudomonadota bacterium]